MRNVTHIVVPANEMVDFLNGKSDLRIDIEVADDVEFIFVESTLSILKRNSEFRWDKKVEVTKWFLKEDLNTIKRGVVIGRIEWHKDLGKTINVKDRAWVLMI